MMAQGMVLAGVELNQARDSYGRGALHIAVERGNVGLARLMVDHAADVNIISIPQGDTALHVAAMQGHLVCIQLLVEARALLNQLDAEGETALSLSSGDGNLKAVRSLLKARAIPEVECHQCAARAPVKGHAKYCMKSCPNMGCVSPLLRAVENNADCEVVSELIKANAGVGVTDCEYNQPLHLAVINRNMRTVRLLLANDADPECCNFAWRKPLHCIDNGNSRIVKLLVDHRACPDAEELKVEKIEPSPFELSQEHVRDNQVQKLTANKSATPGRRLVGSPSSGLQHHGQNLVLSASDPCLTSQGALPQQTLSFVAGAGADHHVASSSSGFSQMRSRRMMPRAPSLSKVGGAVLSPPSSPAAAHAWGSQPPSPPDGTKGSLPPSPASASSSKGASSKMDLGSSLPRSPQGRKSLQSSLSTSLSTDVGGDSLSSFSTARPGGLASRQGNLRNAPVAWG